MIETIHSHSHVAIDPGILSTHRGVWALKISLAIFGIVLQAAREVFSRVMDAVDPRLIDEIVRVASGMEEVKSVHDVRARWLGHEILVDLSIGVNRALSVAEGHHIATHVHHELLHHIPHLHKVTIHVDPDDQIGEIKHFHSHLRYV